MSPTVKPQGLGGYCISPLELQRCPACCFLVYLIVVPIVLSQFKLLFVCCPIKVSRFCRDGFTIINTAGAELDGQLYACRTSDICCDRLTFLRANQSVPVPPALACGASVTAPVLTAPGTARQGK